MEPLSPIVAAVVAGAAAALQSTVGEAVKDGYAALKRALAARYGSVDVIPIERDPTASDARSTVERQLNESGASADSELLSLAKKLLEEVVRNEPKLASVIGVDLEKVKAATVRIEDIASAGAGVRVKDAVAIGDFVVSNVRAGGGGGPALGKR